MSQLYSNRLKERSDLLTEIFHSGYSALRKVRNAVDGATNVKGVGDVAHPRYLDRFQIGKREVGVHMDGAISLGSGYQRVRS